MTLPEYFIADLPAEAPLAASLIVDACQTIKRNAEHYLAHRSTRQMIGLLDKLGQEWLSDESRYRQYLLQAGPAATGFSERTLIDGLDSFFSQLTAANLEALIEQELGHAQRLDHFSADQPSRQALARGPQLVAHIAAGNIPNPILTSMVLGLLTRSAQFVKCATGQMFIPRLFAHSIYEADPKLGACLEIAEWKGGRIELESALFDQADCVTATGSDDTLASIRASLPRRVRFLGYGTRVSFGYIAREALSALHSASLARRAATDVIAWNQLGCLSPHVFYVENGGDVTPEGFAELLAGELAAMELTHPRGHLSHHHSAAIATRRSFYEVRAAHSPDTRLWASDKSTAWTVIFDNDPHFQLSCLNRLIYVKAVSSVEEALYGAEPAREHMSTVGLAATSIRAAALANQFARWGASRICPLGQMQTPPLTWRHDGRPSLGDLVIWSEWEK